jgi:dCTP deaminase
MTFLDYGSLRQRIRAGHDFVAKLGESIDKDPRAFWEKNLKALNDDFIIVDPFDEGRIESASYELLLGRQCYATSEELPKVLGRGLTSKYIKIEPGEFAVLTTEEYVYVPTKLMGLISIKYGKKEKGLVNVSGFHVDPGFFGRLVFTVYNAGPGDVILEEGEKVFMIMFAELSDRTTKPYSGKHQAQSEIPPDVVASLRGTSVSPRNLEERLKKLELWIYLLTATILPIVIALLLTIARAGK